MSQMFPLTNSCMHLAFFFLPAHIFRSSMRLTTSPFFPDVSSFFPFLPMQFLRNLARIYLLRQSLTMFPPQSSSLFRLQMYWACLIIQSIATLLWSHVLLCRSRVNVGKTCGFSKAHVIESYLDHIQSTEHDQAPIEVPEHHRM